MVNRGKGDLQQYYTNLVTLLELTKLFIFMLSKVCMNTARPKLGLEIMSRPGASYDSHPHCISLLITINSDFYPTEICPSLLHIEGERK